jgi:glyoxylase-like metal-dependent hydrolase (beta-lactamase superfamily II)
MIAVPDSGVATISVEELRSRLERREPVTVLDVRTARDRAEWAIPGSLHVDAYDALWAGDPRALATIDLPREAPVVTVCGHGRTSRIAARHLAARGFSALSLEGGMEAWSLAWNTAEVPIQGTDARVIQIRRTGKGCLSYVVGSDADAAVIDPALEPAVYVDLAARRGWTIRSILDTHIHADHLSRARALAAATGATLCLPTTPRARFPFVALDEGDIVRVGAATLSALHTPGHTPESTCYGLDGRALFTGDTLFLSAVGRPDLEATPDETRDRARLLHTSLRRLLTLDAETLILPGHTNSPVAFDGRPIAAPLSVVRASTPLLQADVEDFIASLLARIPPAPPNHHRIVECNEAGSFPEGNPTALEAGANRCAVG